MVGILNYGLGNVAAVLNMLTKINVKARIISTPEQILSSDRIIIPGVGSFDNGVQLLKDRDIFDVIKLITKEKNIPILGICLGMQLLFNNSSEGEKQGLKLIDANVIGFNKSKLNGLRVPHFGWSDIDYINPKSKLLNNFKETPRFYFAHSYHVEIDKTKSSVMGLTNYGYEFCSVIEQDNIMGVQFHPEKSHSFGMKLLSNFSKI